jgi:hypothetical protein
MLNVPGISVAIHHFVSIFGIRIGWRYFREQKKGDADQYDISSLSHKERRREEMAKVAPLPLPSLLYYHYTPVVSGSFLQALVV